MTDIIKPKIEPYVKDWVVSVGGKVGDHSVDAMSQSAAPQIEQRNTATIGGELARLVTPHLSETLVPPLLETLSAQIEQSTIELTQRYVTKGVTAMLSMDLTESINAGLVESIPSDELHQKIGLRTARLMTRPLNHILSRSLSHAIVPSLLHTTSHNPLQDFYCYYCFHHKAYCQYCTYAPSQVYYAIYYAGFYSNYYSDYYANAMLRQLKHFTNEDE